jgi:hypothetical protein
MSAKVATATYQDSTAVFWGKIVFMLAFSIANRAWRRPRSLSPCAPANE